jgi:hypothetical protein
MLFIISEPTPMLARDGGEAARMNMTFDAL